jgi:hypothetical protein
MESRTPAETQEIYIRLEHYDDIFSDFDMRPYAKRSLSVDFLDEMKRAARDKEEEGIELILHAPERHRDQAHEATIRERLAAHFKRHHDLLAKEKRGMLERGFSMVALGVICMIAATLIIFADITEQNLVFSFLLVFLEPAAWFLLWEGMDQVVFNSKNINPELEFYRKMASERSRVSFQSY